MIEKVREYRVVFLTYTLKEWITIGWLDPSRQRETNSLVSLAKGMMRENSLSVLLPSAYQWYTDGVQLSHLAKSDATPGGIRSAKDFKEVFSRDVRVHFVGAWYDLIL